MLWWRVMTKNSDLFTILFCLCFVFVGFGGPGDGFGAPVGGFSENRSGRKPPLLLRLKNHPQEHQNHHQDQQNQQKQNKKQNKN